MSRESLNTLDLWDLRYLLNSDVGITPGVESGVEVILIQANCKSFLRFTLLMLSVLKGNSMPQKTVLSVGQCRPDQAAISHYLTSHFDAKVVATDTAAETYQLLKNQTVDLVMINRKLDADYSDGMEILQCLCSDKSMSEIPVMLISNFAEWQEKAVALGAVHGFGKAELNLPETKQRLSSFLE